MALEHVGTGQYGAKITPLKGRSDRVDVAVDVAPYVEAFASTDIISHIRAFFDALEQEAQQHAGDPVALTHALARLEALLADVRYVTATVRDLDAQALREAKIRRLTVSEVATVEGVGSIDRTNWRHRSLMMAMMAATNTWIIDLETGVVLEADEAADRLLSWFGPNWKLTPIREAGLDPHDYCDVATDDDGRAQSSPAVKMVDNLIRRLK